jgi:transposase
MGKPTNFTPEYKKEIIKLVTEQKKSNSEVARSIGVRETTIRDWVKKYSEHGEKAFPGKGNLRPDDKELRDLKNKVKDLEMENEVLKKAMAIFSRDVKINTK